MPKAIILGAGLAGLSLGVELAQRNFDVTILEKENILGGRASNTLDKRTHDPVPIGPHIFLSSFSHYKRFLQKIGAESDISWERTNFIDIVEDGKHFQMKSPRLPAPFYVLPMALGSPLLGPMDAMSTFFVGMKGYFASLSSIDALDTTDAYSYLKRLGVTNTAIEKFFRFLSISLLNVPLELCSAGELLLLMQYWARMDHHEIGFAKVGLGDLYTTKAQSYITNKRGKIKLGKKVRKIVIKNRKIDHLLLDKGKITADLYVSTLTPLQLREILPLDLMSGEFFGHLNAFEPVPYITVSLWFDKKITQRKFWALLSSKKRQYFNTDFYDQSNIYKGHRDYSLITSNIIYSRPYHHLSDREIVNQTLYELSMAVSIMKAKLTHSVVHRVPYVVYAPYPGMRQHKLPHTTPISNFYLAGDWTVRDAPQCMDTAVKSGVLCSQKISSDYGID